MLYKSSNPYILQPKITLPNNPLLGSDQSGYESLAR